MIFQLSKILVATADSPFCLMINKLLSNYTEIIRQRAPHAIILPFFPLWTTLRGWKDSNPPPSLPLQWCCSKPKVNSKEGKHFPQFNWARSKGTARVLHEDEFKLYSALCKTFFDYFFTTTTAENLAKSWCGCQEKQVVVFNLPQFNGTTRLTPGSAPESKG